MRASGPHSVVATLRPVRAPGVSANSSSTASESRARLPVATPGGSGGNHCPLVEIPPNVTMESEGCQSKLRAALAESSDLKNKLSSALLRHRPVERTGGEHGISQAPGQIDDGDLVQRVDSAYRAAVETEGTADHSLWSLTSAER